MVLQLYDTNKNIVLVCGHLAQRDALLSISEEIQANFEKNSRKLDSFYFHNPIFSGFSQSTILWNSWFRT